ncbi:MAG TPA: PQQ-binding-like beta-propeller repeat protein [Candidatus Eremiobacteraceae bacterium]|nr:PQQ-binding-like beta-propeller repeat protein [Candidatus Eremiobacteraceae bacterium]
MYRRTYDGHARVPFTRVDASNVARLRVAFTFDDPSLASHETAPIVNGRFLIATLPDDGVVALDATDGRTLWTYHHQMTPGATDHICCGAVNRGAAAFGGDVFIATIDCRVVALDARDGGVVWSRSLAPAGRGYSFTGAPLVVDDRVIVGSAGGEYPTRGFIAALDPATGALRWRHETIAAPSEPGGDTWPRRGARWGGAAWQTGSYDAQSDTLYWGVGNPMPWRGDRRQGANLYTDSLLALDPATGRMKWHFQFTPHDLWDYDGTNEPVLVDLHAGKRVEPAIYQANRNGFFFLLDRAGGRFISATPFVPSTTIDGYDADGSERPAERDARLSCPGTVGGKNWPPSAFDPATGLAFFGIVHACTRMLVDPQADNGEDAAQYPEPGARGYGAFIAWDVRARRVRWSFPSELPWYDGAVATASGLVFSGGADGVFRAFDERTGAVLWQHDLGAAVAGVPVIYIVGGKQYVAVFAGWDGGVARQGPLAQRLAGISRPGRLFVFTLP